MSARAPHISKTSKFGPYAVHINDGDGDASMALEAGERLGGPMRRRRRSVVVLKLVLIGCIAAGGGWAWVNHQATLMEWSAAVTSAVSPMLTRSTPAQVASSQPLPQAPPALPPLETREPPPATVVPSSAIAVLPSPQAEPNSEDAPGPVEKLPPAVADPADPYQVRALAAGLHPGLSRALLARLSDADYRNAKIAIDTALAETPDTKVFVYPRTRKPELALFQVKFVRGVTPDCRRYVVMVTKDGWLTTAMPMEKCGVVAKQARKAN